MFSSLLRMAPVSRDLSQADKRMIFFVKLSKLIKIICPRQTKLSFCEFAQLYITVRPKTSGLR